MADPVETFWQQQRRRVWCKPGTTNLNAGTMSPTPRPVLAAVRALRQMQAANPSDFLWRQTPPLLARSRRRLAEYLNGKARNLLLLPNVTTGINIVAAALPLPPGSEILTTDHEYGAMLMTWQRLCAQRQWRLSQVELPFASEDPQALVRAVAAGFTRQTRVLFFSHVTSSTGLVLPARELCALARGYGAFSVIDGAHAPGLAPVDVTAIGADFYGANCHKWLMAPACCGFLHVRSSRRRMLDPLTTSWGWNYAPARLDQAAVGGGTCWQYNLEFHGCEDRTPQMVLDTVLDFRATLGGDAAVFGHCRELAAYARRKLSACGLIPVTPVNPELSGALSAYEFPARRPAPPNGWLWAQHRIECPITVAAGRSFLRVSTAWFNTCQDIDRLAEALG